MQRTSAASPPWGDDQRSRLRRSPLIDALSFAAIWGLT